MSPITNRDLGDEIEVEIATQPLFSSRPYRPTDVYDCTHRYLAPESTYYVCLRCGAMTKDSPEISVTR